MAEHTPPPGQERDFATPESAREVEQVEREARPTGWLTGRRLGDYHLQELLGAGGMADVYRAYDLILMREVAVKVLAGPLADDPAYVDRFRTEARRVAALSHPHLVQVYHAGEDKLDGQRLLYLVMPLLQGSLHDLLKREGKLPYVEATWLALQVADGLEAAHRLGLVHRDVKPENILLDAEGQALLADFGVAREARYGQRSTTAWSGLAVGTPEYMAPEQLRGGRVDQRADIYGLGSVLYELLTGRLPFTGETPYDLAERALNAPLMPPTAYAPDIPPALEQVVLRAMARNANDRYPSVAAFALAARQAVSQQSAGALPLAAGMAGMTTTLPMPPHAWSSPRSLVLGAYRSRRWILSAVLAAAIVLASLGGAVVALQHRGQDPSSAPNAPGSGPLAQTSPTSTGSLFPGQTPLTTPLTTPRATSTVRIRPTSTPVATATAAPQSTLTITPTPLVLTPSPQNAKTCIATQTVRNNTSDTVGWTWQQPKIGGLHFQIDGGPTVDWPPTTTNAPPGGHNTLVVTADCKPTSVSYAVLVKDSLGGQYTFVMTLQ
jgi:serine/threonine-protein kinase